MNRKSVASLAAVAGVAAILCGAPAASAAPMPADLVPMELPAGTACDFGLRVEGVDSKRHLKEFKDEAGKVVRSIEAGKGYALTFTNLTSGASVTLESNGSVKKSTYDVANGTSINAVTGHNVLIFFPTDIPAGPSTTLYTGRTVYTVDASGVWTLQSTAGQSFDICAALS
jgi:hypothetical protein